MSDNAWQELADCGMPLEAGITTLDAWGLAYYAVCGTRLYRSGSGMDGYSWGPFGFPLPDGATVHTLTFVNGRGVAATARGVYVKDNSLWVLATRGLPARTGTLAPIATTGLACFDGTLFVGIREDPNFYTGVRIYRSTDRGENWTASAAGFPPPSAPCSDPTVFAVKDGIIFAGTFEQGLFASRDGGRSWALVKALGSRERICSLMVSGGHLYVGTAWQGLLRSASGLDGFVELQQNAAHGTRQLTEVRAMASTPNGRVIAYFGQNVYFSDNVGDAWTRYSNGLPRMANGEGPEFDHLATNGITIIGDARTRWLTPNRHVYIVPV